MKSFFSLLSLLTFCLAFEVITPNFAEARMGRGGSIGRSSGRSFRPQSNRSQYQRQQPQSPYQQPAQNPSRGGSMLRNMAGGMAAGFLGSMLFNSLGFGRGMSGFGGTGGSGFGFFEILLIVGAGYLVFRMLRKKKDSSLEAQSFSTQPSIGSLNYQARNPEHARENFYQQAGQIYDAPPVQECIKEDEATDIFFQLQAAWTRKNLELVKNLLGHDLQQILNEDLQQLKRLQHTNRLENISLRQVEIGEPEGQDREPVSLVRFTANLLDYTVDDTTGRVIEGSDSQPVRFEEIWTFRKSAIFGHWQLIAIEQT